MAGFPTLDDVRAWWDETFPPGGCNRGDHSNHRTETDRYIDTYAENGDHQASNHRVTSSDRDHSMITPRIIRENSINKPNTDGESSVITPITHHTHPSGNSHGVRLRAYLDSPPEWFVKQAKKCIDEGAPEHLVKPLASSVADDCLGDPFRWREVLPAVEDKLKEMA